MPDVANSLNIFKIIIWHREGSPRSLTKFHPCGSGNVCLRTWRCGENFVSPQCSVSVRLTHYSERGTIAINRVVTSLVG